MFICERRAEKQTLGRSASGQELTSGQKDFPSKLPAILGKDVSGVVLEIGNEVRTFKPSDRVIAMSEASYAEDVAVPAALPDGVDLIAA